MISFITSAFAFSMSLLNEILTTGPCIMQVPWSWSLVCRNPWEVEGTVGWDVTFEHFLLLHVFGALDIYNACVCLPFCAKALTHFQRVPRHITLHLEGSLAKKHFTSSSSHDGPQGNVWASYCVILGDEYLTPFIGTFGWSACFQAT